MKSESEAENLQVTCGICQSPAKEMSRNFKGYKVGQFFNIFECQTCGSSFCDPLEVDPEIYKDIYQHGEVLAGYNRYHAYFRTVKYQKSPLEFLAKQEECYWFIEDYLRNNVDKQHSKLLEVGSGLGYLTYSLHRSGYNVQGVELSSVAVNKATEQFGKLYRCEDALKLVDDGERFDVILLTEVIEHLTQPTMFIQMLSNLLSPGGCILVTTPNKDYPLGKLLPWGTDLPPVHLWWFTKNAMRKMAEFAGLSVSFYRFRDWHKTNFPRKLLKQPKINNPKHIMNLDGSPIKPKRKSIKQKGVFKRLKNWLNYVRYKESVDLDEGVIIGAVFKK